MGVLLNRRRYMGALKQAKALFEMYDQYFDGTVNSVVNTGLKLWDGTHNRWKMEVVYQRITAINSNITLFAVRPDASPYSGIRVRQRSSYSFSLTISDTWETIENAGNFYIYENSSFGNAIEKSSSLEYDTLTLIRDGQYLYCDYNGQTATLRITDPLTNNLNLLIGCDYKGANNKTQRYYTGTVQKFVIKELPPADEIIMTSITNPEVLAVCYAQGWCADANYMTKSEAEAVTDIGNAFYGSSIVHFDEFQYFINASLATMAFANTASLNSIYVPADLAYEIFYNSAVKDVYICEGVSTISAGAFRDSKQLRLIDMPSTLLSTTGYLHNCFPTTDTTIVCRATTPPSINAWGNGFRTVTIYVPDSSVATYQAAPVWSTYASNIKPISEYE